MLNYLKIIQLRGCDKGWYCWLFSQYCKAIWTFWLVLFNLFAAHRSSEPSWGCLKMILFWFTIRRRIIIRRFFWKDMRRLIIMTLFSNRRINRWLLLYHILVGVIVVQILLFHLSVKNINFLFLNIAQVFVWSMLKVAPCWIHCVICGPNPACDRLRF